MCVFPNLGPVYLSFGFTWRVFETTVTAQRSCAREANGVSMLTGFSEQECKLFTHAVVSQWLIDEQELHCDQDQIHFRFTELVLVYGPGFGDRGISDWNNIYFGYRASDQSVYS
jgi:hypothetical protein